MKNNTKTSKSLFKFATIVAALAMVVGARQASALSENWSALNGTFLTLQDTSTPLAQGDLIEIGIDTNNATLSLSSGIAGAAGSLDIFASSTVGTGIGVEGAFTVASASPGAGFFSDQIYLLAVNASTLGAATQIGVFTDSSWVFPASDGASANSLDLSDAGVTAVIGSLHTGTISDSNLTSGGPNVNAASLAAVPEPSSIALVAAGLLGLVGISRRRK